MLAAGLGGGEAGGESVGVGLELPGASLPPASPPRPGSSGADVRLAVVAGDGGIDDTARRVGELEAIDSGSLVSSNRARAESPPRTTAAWAAPPPGVSSGNVIDTRRGGGSSEKIRGSPARTIGDRPLPPARWKAHSWVKGTKSGLTGKVPASASMGAASTRTRPRPDDRSTTQGSPVSSRAETEAPGSGASTGRRRGRPRPAGGRRPGRRAT